MIERDRNHPCIILWSVGNGDPAWQERERPLEPDTRSFEVKSFNGLAQVLLQSTGAPGEALLSVGGEGTESHSITLSFK